MSDCLFHCGSYRNSSIIGQAEKIYPDLPAVVNAALSNRICQEPWIFDDVRIQVNGSKPASTQRHLIQGDSII